MASGGSLHCVGEKQSRVFSGLLSGVQSEALERFVGIGMVELPIERNVLRYGQKQVTSEESTVDSGSSYLSELSMRGLKARPNDDAQIESPCMCHFSPSLNRLWI